MASPRSDSHNGIHPELGKRTVRSDLRLRRPIAKRLLELGAFAAREGKPHAVDLLFGGIVHEMHRDMVLINATILREDVGGKALEPD